MKITSLKIKSYRSCINTNLDIQKGLTGIIGANGSGKTNILHAVLLLKKLSTSTRRIWHRGSDSLYNSCTLEVCLTYKSKPVVAKIKIFYETDEENDDEIINYETTWDFSSLFNVSSGLKLTSDTIRYQTYLFDRNISTSSHKSLWVNAHNDSKEETDISTVYPHVSNILKQFSKISYYGASQFADPSHCPNFIEIEEDRPVRSYRSSDRHEKFITDLYKLYKEKDKQNSKYQLYISTVDNAGIGLVDSISFKEVPIPSSSYKVTNGGEVNTYPRNRMLVVPSFNIDGNLMSPSQLSEGTFRTLALVYYLLTDDNDILLIEEPEVGVHHGLLNSIISIIKSQSNDKQIIISTHSDFVLDQLKPDEVVLVNRIISKGTIAKSLSKALSKSEYLGLKMYLKEFGNLGEYWKESGFNE